MATATKPPFHQFTFTQDTGAFHALFDLSAAQDGAYALHVKRTPTPAPGETEAAPAAASAEIAPAAASAPEAVPAGMQAVEFTRTMPEETARTLKNDLAALGVFRWDPDYHDEQAPGTGTWKLTIVFQQDVFTFEAKGQQSAPDRFGQFLETLYQLDFPRPEDAAAKPDEGPARASRPRGSGIEGMRGDGSSNPFDASALFGAAGANPLGDMDAATMERMNQAFASMAQNPNAFMDSVRDEFRTLSPDEQRQLLDMLGTSGIQSRDWWERFSARLAPSFAR